MEDIHCLLEKISTEELWEADGSKTLPGNKFISQMNPNVVTKTGILYLQPALFPGRRDALSSDQYPPVLDVVPVSRYLM